MLLDLMVKFNLQLNETKPNWTLGGTHAVQSITRSNTKTTSQPRTFSCSRCNGNSLVYNNGYTYSCSRCSGTGKMVIM